MSPVFKRHFARHSHVFVSKDHFHFIYYDSAPRYTIHKVSVQDIWESYSYFDQLYLRRSLGMGTFADVDETLEIRNKGVN